MFNSVQLRRSVRVFKSAVKTEMKMNEMKAASQGIHLSLVQFCRLVRSFTVHAFVHCPLNS